MLSKPLIVPTILVTGSLHFAEVSEDSIAEDVVNVLTVADRVKNEVLGDLDDHGWALQRIRMEPSARLWEEGELESLGDGVISNTTPIAPLVVAASASSKSQRHFSSFPLTSHLHTPVVRLVSLHPHLSFRVTFFRVPEIHDGYEYTLFISRTTTVNEIIGIVIEELGLTKSLPIPGGGTVEYALEEVWLDSRLEKSLKLPMASLMHHILVSAFSSNPFSRSAKRGFRFCVPEEWYRRSKPRISLGASLEPSELTIKRLASLQEAEDEEEAEGTAKMRDVANSEAHQPSILNTEGKDSTTRNNRSSLVDWIRPMSPTSLTRNVALVGADVRKSVSGPILLDHATGNAFSNVDLGKDLLDDADDADFRRMVDDMGLSGEKQTTMNNLPLTKKRLLLQQYRMRLPGSAPRDGQPLYPATYGPSSGSAVLPRLVPQLTGENGFINRFSIISGWGGPAAATSVVSSNTTRLSGEFDSSSSGKGRAQVEKVVAEMQPLQPQITGSILARWLPSSWISSGKDETNKSPRWYIDTIRGKPLDDKLIKHLLLLRVHLSTAKINWIEEFVMTEKGLDALGLLLAGLVGKHGKSRDLTEAESSVLLEIIKCLRILLNTEIGFSQVLVSSTLITHMAYGLHASSPKLRILTSEVLSAICDLSRETGHKAVLAAFSDYRIMYDESFRFQDLISSLHLPDFDYSVDSEGTDESSTWEARAASMTLVNALTNSPESLEDRVLLREEFGRRGLNEIIVTLRYVRPPDSILKQLDTYTEDKFEDEEDMRERARVLWTRDESLHQRQRSDSEVALQDLVVLAKQHGELYPMMVEILNHYGEILQRDIGMQLKADLFAVLDRFVEQATLLDNFGDSWHLFLKRFAASVQHITGQELEVKAASESSLIVEQELEELRNKVEELSDERTELRNELSQKVAEINTLKSLPLNFPGPQLKRTGKSGPESFQGVVQKLVQKEKQVLQLQAELERFQTQNPNDRQEDERAKRERDRIKWNTLMDDIAKLKTKNTELQSSLEIKEKEIAYLKRALESVYTRFTSREEAREQQDMDAEQLVARMIEKLVQRDDQITYLSKEVEGLRAQLIAKPRSEKEFKAKSPPPPPPPPSKKPPQVIKSQAPYVGLAPPAPPPPPPPPLMIPPSPAVLPAAQNDMSPPALDTPHIAPPFPQLPNGISPPPPPPPPPPAPGIPPPPPPPPPSAFRMHVKPMATRPAKRLKPFFWNKIGGLNVSSTVWNDVSTDIQLDLEDLEATFAIDNSQPTPSQILSPTRKQNVTTLLDITRANNVAIMLSRIKISFTEIREALLTLDDAKLTIDNLKAISRHLPSVEEIARLKDFDDVKKLAKADQYFSQIMNIPRLQERLECMTYRRRIDLDITELRPELVMLHNAVHELRTSQKFKRILQTVLSVGNFLNASTFRGNARGFQLGALLKLKEMKTAKGGPDCPTLLHYVARVLMRKDPSLVTFIEDLPNVEPAARVSVQTIFQSANALIGGLNQIEAEIQEHRRAGSLPDDRFIHIMQPFATQAKFNVEELKNTSNSLDGELKSLLVYYGEDVDSPEALKPEDFFGLVSSFSSSLQRCALEVHDAQQKPGLLAPKPPEVTVEAAPKSQENTVKAAPTPSNQALDPSSSEYAKRSIGRGDLDHAIRSMREGRRRARPEHQRPLSKIFLGGARPQSRHYD